MHDQHTISAQAFASMTWEKSKHAWPVDGVDDLLGDLIDNADDRLWGPHR